MSEFSESYHLVGEEPAAVDALLARAGVRGVVAGTSGGWTSFVVRGRPTFAPDPALVDANTGVLLHYWNAEDHGCGVALYRGPSLVAATTLEWDDELRVRTEGGWPAGFEAALCPPLPAARVRSAIEALAITDLDDALQEAGGFDVRNPGHRCAEALGLPAYEWLAGDRAAGDPSAGAPAQAGQPGALSLAELLDAARAAVPPPGDGDGVVRGLGAGWRPVADLPGEPAGGPGARPAGMVVPTADEVVEQVRPMPRLDASGAMGTLVDTWLYSCVVAGVPAELGEEILARNASWDAVDQGSQANLWWAHLAAGGRAVEVSILTTPAGLVVNVGSPVP